MQPILIYLIYWLRWTHSSKHYQGNGESEITILTGNDLRIEYFKCFTFLTLSTFFFLFVGLIRPG